MMHWCLSALLLFLHPSPFSIQRPPKASSATLVAMAEPPFPEKNCTIRVEDLDDPDITGLLVRKFVLIHRLR
jgi:hypothetical protein